MYMSIPIAQFIPPPPYPLLTVSWFSISVTLFYFCFVSKFICSLFLGFPCGSDGKETACNVGDLGSTPGLERSLGGGHGNPIQYS